MEKGMNKDELINMIESMQIDFEEIWILSTSVLVLRGLFSNAGDLDIAVTKKRKIIMKVLTIKQSWETLIMQKDKKALMIELNKMKFNGFRMKICKYRKWSNK